MKKEGEETGSEEEREGTKEQEKEVVHTVKVE